MKQVHESFSALMDNEADEFDLRRVLKTMKSSPEQSETWRRYHLARSMMQRDRSAVVDADISADVFAAIADEPRPEPLATAEGGKRHSFSFMKGASVAAAVSLMVISGVQVYNGRFGGESGTSDVASTRDGTGAVASFADATPAMEGGATPASMEAPASGGLPMFSVGSGNGVMTVSEPVMQPMFSGAGFGGGESTPEQSPALQAYLQHRAGEASYDGAMPLLRSPGNFAGPLHQIDASGTP
ncbi:sigma-E factor negative regulatory protein [Salinicola rhizosphaerae]|nr:sigma-E factor negative regulatory protein [Salinicola rhizosphaerae]